MTGREEIFVHVKRLLVGQFELDPAAVTPGARLYDDLDIDSIDAVDLVVRLQQLTRRRFKPEEFRSVRTVSDVIDRVHDLAAEPVPR
jgi:acyl carrier protein